MHSILIIDDDDFVLKSLARLLRSEELGISCYHDPEEALIQCAVREFDLILSDQRMPGMLGTEFFEQIAISFPATRRILISGYTDFDDVIQAFNSGVIHKFVVKPWNNLQLKEIVNEELGQIGSSELQSAKPPANPQPIFDDSAEHSHHGIVTRNPAMLQQLAIIEKTAGSDAPFFINGETGTGKEMVARAIHSLSDRADREFLALNCANLTEALLESQLFGHKKGSFTGADRDQKGMLEEAEGGTLFLDEVVEIPLALQAKLLRVLQEREYTPVGETKARKFDVKVISASALSLEKAVAEGRFREDLRYRLEVMPINLPPLRARGSDIRLLFDYFLESQLGRHGLAVIPVDDAVYQALQSYSWPGNVRELVNVCTYIAALASSEDALVSLDKLPLAVTTQPRPSTQESAISAAVKPDLSRPALTRQNLEQAISDFGGHRENIAEHFGISRMTLWRKMKQFDLA